MFRFVSALLMLSSTGALVAPLNGHCSPKHKPSHQAQGVSSFDAFCQMRSGLCPEEKTGVFGDPVFWAADGELYQTPSGTILARIEGLETSHAVRLENGAVRIFSRKLVWFRDPDTNEIMDEYQGKPIIPIRFDAQVIDLEEGEKNAADDSLTQILPFVVRSKRLVPCMPVTPRWGGCDDILMFQVPLFIDIEIPIPSEDGGPPKTRGYQAWEFYDYAMNINYDTPPILSWTRQGASPPFVMSSTGGVTHARGHRVDSFEELPQSIQDYVNENYPLFRGPPQSMEEVDCLEH